MDPTNWGHWSSKYLPEHMSCSQLILFFLLRNDTYKARQKRCRTSCRGLDWNSMKVQTDLADLDHFFNLKDYICIVPLRKNYWMWVNFSCCLSWCTCSCAEKKRIGNSLARPIEISERKKRNQATLMKLIYPQVRKKSRASFEKVTNLQFD